jgi:hypothetical protein
LKIIFFGKTNKIFIEGLRKKHKKSKNKDQKEKEHIKIHGGWIVLTTRRSCCMLQPKSDIHIDQE